MRNVQFLVFRISVRIRFCRRCFRNASQEWNETKNPSPLNGHLRVRRRSVARWPQQSSPGGRRPDRQSCAHAECQAEASPESSLAQPRRDVVGEQLRLKNARRGAKTQHAEMRRGRRQKRAAWFEVCPVWAGSSWNAAGLTSGNRWSCVLA